MGKRDFGNLSERLAPVAASQPSLRPPAALSVVPSAEPEPSPVPVVGQGEPAATSARLSARKGTAAKAAPALTDEGIVQQTFNIRPSLRKQLHRLAAEDDKTVGGFILAALRAKGLNVLETDITDGRKARR